MPPTPQEFLGLLQRHRSVDHNPRLPSLYCYSYVNAFKRELWSTISYSFVAGMLEGIFSVLGVVPKEVLAQHFLGNIPNYLTGIIFAGIAGFIHQASIDINNRNAFNTAMISLSTSINVNEIASARNSLITLESLGEIIPIYE